MQNGTQEVVGSGASVSPSRRTKRHTVGLTLGLALSGSLLVSVFSGLDWSALKEQFERLSWGIFPLMIVSTLAIYFLRALRWREMLPETAEPVSLRLLFDATTIGMFANAVLPLRAGEFAKPWVIKRFSNLSFSVALASTVTERLFDVLGLLVCLSVVFTQLSSVPPMVVLGAKALGILCVILVGVIALAYGARGWLLASVERLASSLLPERISGPLFSIFSEFITGITAIRSVRSFLLSVFYTGAIWGLFGVYHLAGFWLLGEYPPFSFGVLTAVVVALAVAAPSGPGFVGTYQFGCVVAISTICRYPKEFALAYSIVMHVFQTLFLCVIGFYLVQKRGLMFRDLQRGGEENRDTPVAN